MAPTWFYPGSACFYSSGRLNISYDSGTLISGQINLTKKGQYEYTIDLLTGKIDAPPDNPDNVPESCPGPTAIILGTLLVLCIRQKE